MRTRTFTEEIQRWRESGMKTRLCFEGCRGDTKELEDLKFPADYTDFSGMFKNCKDIFFFFEYVNDFKISII